MRSEAGMNQPARVLCSAALLVALTGASLACQSSPRGAESTQPAAGAPAGGAGGQALAGGAPAPAASGQAPAAGGGGRARGGGARPPAASGQAPAAPSGAAAPTPLKVKVSQPLDALSL